MKYDPLAIWILIIWAAVITYTTARLVFSVRRIRKTINYYKDLLDDFQDVIPRRRQPPKPGNRYRQIP